MESRWHRPTVYVTVVSIHLMLLIALDMAIIVYISRGTWGGSAIGLGALDAVYAVVLILASVVLTIPSAIGAVQLLRGHHTGPLVSLIALVLWTVALSFVVIPLLQGARFGPEYWLTIPALIANSSMYALLVKGWKGVQWR